MAPSEQLWLSDKLHVPLDYVTLTTCILAKKGAGKTYTAKRITELLLKKGAHVVILDLTGVWWGLRSSHDGKSEGFPITIMGGEHADLPLRKEAGELTARAIVEQGFNCILDLSLFSKGEAHQFAAPFLESLYKLNRQALHLMVDEADFYAPQKTFTPQAAMTLGAIDSLVRRGRARGIGITMITQRPQILNKDVLTQADILIALRMNHHLEIKALNEWVSVKADPAKAAEMVTTLPGLPTGELWLWAPELDILSRGKVSPTETFDSSRTPKIGETLRRPKVLAPIDVTRLGDRISAVIEEQRANDPARLRAEIASLRRNIVEPDSRIAELRQLVERNRAAWDELCQGMLAHAQRLEAAADELRQQALALRADVGASVKLYDTSGKLLIDGKTGKTARETTRDRVSLPPERSAAQKQLTARPERRETSDGALPQGVARVVGVLRQQAPLSRATLAARAGYANSGGFRNILSEARQRGLINRGEPVDLTDEGRAVEAYSEPLPSGPALIDYWCTKLDKGEATVLRILAEADSDGMPRAELAEKAGRENSGGFRNTLSTLRVMGLLDYGEPVKLIEDVWRAMQ
jgi:hypothetical protein